MGFSSEFDQDDDAQVHSDRVIKAVEKEYEGEDYRPRVVVTIEYPGNEERTLGKTAIASTGDDTEDTFRMLLTACMITVRQLRLDGKDFALPTEIEHDAFLKNVAEEVLKKEKAFDNIPSGDVELSTSDKWLLAALNQGFGVMLYGEEKAMQFAEKFTKAIPQTEET